MFIRKVLGNILSEKNFLHKDIFSRNNKTTASMPATSSGLVGGSGGKPSVGGSGGLYKPGVGGSRALFIPSVGGSGGLYKPGKNLGGSASAQVITYDPLTNITYTDASKTKILPPSFGGMGNPAAVFAQQRGLQTNIVTDANGGQRGMVTLPDGRQVEEWKYYRDNHNVPKPVPSDSLRRPTMPVRYGSPTAHASVHGKPSLFQRGFI